MKTRLAVVADVAAIADLHAESWRVAYRGMLRDDYLDREIFSERLALWEQRFQACAPNQYVAVTEIDGKVVGFACAYGDEDARWGSFLDNLHVSPEFKRRGIGKALMQQVGAWSAKEHPACGMYLWVLESNSPAMQFYEKLGGVRSGKGKWNPPDGGSYTKFRYAWKSLAPLLSNRPL
ncbi:MAG TPA: GNAT family N-acetyltransferase [Burkholderiales bacterium]|nr:GNAT family N-acetyltransferase [Burkholderiales bacterium]